MRQIKKSRANGSDLLCLNKNQLLTAAFENESRRFLFAGFGGHSFR
jgi:hypothetical protein